MNTTNSYEMTITDLIELAKGDLDDAQLATRLIKRAALEVKQATNGGLNSDDLLALMNLAAVTDRELRARMAARIAAADAASGGLASALLNAEELPEFP